MVHLQLGVSFVAVAALLSCWSAFGQTANSVGQGHAAKNCWYDFEAKQAKGEIKADANFEEYMNKICAGGEPGQYDPSTKSYYYVANTRPPDAFVALRTEPSTRSGRRITTMPNGTLLEVIQQQNDGWWFVRLVVSGEQGWALSGQGHRRWIECCTPASGTSRDVGESQKKQDAAPQESRIQPALQDEQRAAAERKAAEERRAIREKFVADFKVLNWVGISDLSSNPFVYKGQVIGTRSNFVKMTSEREALFAHGNGTLLLSGVPSTRFRKNDAVVLAIRVSGLKENMPEGEYVGDYICGDRDCFDFLER